MDHILTTERIEMAEFNALIMKLSLVTDVYGKPMAIIKLETPDGVDASQTYRELVKHFRIMEKVKVTIDATD